MILTAIAAAAAVGRTAGREPEAEPIESVPRTRARRTRRLRVLPRTGASALREPFARELAEALARVVGRPERDRLLRPLRGDLVRDRPHLAHDRLEVPRIAQQRIDPRLA